jgi:hypothetical protein
MGVYLLSSYFFQGEVQEMDSELLQELESLDAIVEEICGMSDKGTGSTSGH